MDGVSDGTSPSTVNTNLLYRVISKNVQTLRSEMEAAAKSVENAAKNSAPNGAPPLSPD